MRARKLGIALTMAKRRLPCCGADLWNGLAFNRVASHDRPAHSVEIERNLHGAQGGCLKHFTGLPRLAARDAGEFLDFFWS